MGSREEIRAACEAARAETATVTVPTKNGMPAVWLVWGIPHRGGLDLIAVATTEATRERHVAAGKRRGYLHVQVETAVLDHAYGDGMLTVLNKARRHGE